MTIDQYTQTNSGNSKIRLYKILSTLSFCSIIISALILWNNPIVNYQLDLYFNISPLVWILLILSFVLSSYVLISSQENNQSRGLGIWGNIAFLSLILTCAVILLFPYIRSVWFIGRGDDTLASVGFLRMKLLSGYETSPYPPITNLAASLVYLANMDMFKAAAAIGPLFCLLSIPFTYCLANVVFKNKGMIAVAVISSAIFLYRLPTAKPYYISLVLLPLAVALYLNQNKSIGYRISCYVYFLLLVFIHPIISIVLIIGLLGMEIFKYLGKLEKVNIIKSNVLLLFSSAFITWLVYDTLSFSIGILRREQAFFSSQATTVSSGQSISAITSGITGLDFFSVFIKTYGQNIIILLLTIIGMFIVYKKIRSKVAEMYEYQLFSLSGWVVTTGLFVILSFVFYRIIPTNATRLITVPFVVAPLFVAYFLISLNNPIKYDNVTGWIVRIMPTIKKANIHLAFILFTLGIAFIFMVFSIYPSPFTSVANQQVMKSEIIGAEWVSKYTSINSTIGDLGERINDEAGANWVKNTPTQTEIQMPKHMGYDKVNYQADLSSHPDYITFTQARVLRVEDTSLPKDSLISVSDIERIYNDPTVDMIYSNPNYFAFQIT